VAAASSYGLEARFAFVQQLLKEQVLDASSGQLVSKDTQAGALVWGGALTGALALPLGERWSVALETRAAVLVVPMWDGSRHVVFAPELTLAAGWTF
jgi:hypothetical protein